ncbi:MAG: class I SAM-dependent RNA methyltransferase [Planctomycetota bacterium]
MPPTFELFAACQPGLEPLLAAELQRLGIETAQVPGGASFRGGAATAQRCGLWLGTASHVLLRLAQFPCRALGELQRKAADLPWRSWLRPQVPLQVRATTRGSRIYHTGAAEERIGNAITAAFGRPLPGAHADDDLVARVHVRFRDDVCTLSLDTTGTPLHRRGYRLDGRKAPLREDLAHALLLAGGFQDGDALLDPFCGSGTIAIEAAGLAAGLAPGRLRPPPLQHLALFDADAWQTNLIAPPARRPKAPIVGSDRDEGACGAAKANAERAGVAAWIDFQHAALAAQPWLQEHAAPPQGLLASNPPFGVRVGKGPDLRPLYQTLGNRAARLGEGWRVALLAHDPRLVRRTGLPLQAAFSSKHGGLPVTALVGRTIAAAGS